MVINKPEIKYEEKYVAYLDILGFKDMILEESHEESIETITSLEAEFDRVQKYVYKTFDGLIENSKNDDKFALTLGVDPKGDIEDQLKPSFKMFSDCMCVSCKHKDIFMFAIQVLQAEFAQSGYFLRGGIAKDKHYESNNIIYSKGLVKAYTLESDREKAKYPRIVIHNKVLKELPCDKKIYLKADDGLCFFDFLESVNWCKGEEDRIIKSIRNAIIDQITDLTRKGKEKELNKYNWLVEYFNFKVDPQYMIDSSIFKYIYKNYTFM